MALGLSHALLPKGLHRIRHYGLFANGNRAANIARARELLGVPSHSKPAETRAGNQIGRAGNEFSRTGSIVPIGAM
jgi:hypothetical protein